MIKGAKSKGKATKVAGGTVSPPTGDQSHTTEGTGSIAVRASHQHLICTATQRPTPSNALQDEKADEAAKEQSDREQEQMALDRENLLQEQEKL